MFAVIECEQVSGSMKQTAGKRVIQQSPQSYGIALQAFRIEGTTDARSRERDAWKYS